MKKNIKIIIIVFAILLVLAILIYIPIKINTVNKDKNEALDIFNEYGTFAVFIYSDFNDIDEVKQKIMNIKDIENIEFSSKEQEFNKLKERMDNEIMEDLGPDFLEPVFYIRFKFEKEDLENIRKVVNDLLYEIEDIEGVKKVESSRLRELTNVYDDKGINGLKSICKIYNETENMDSEELLQYYEDNQELIDKTR